MRHENERHRLSACTNTPHKSQKSACTMPQGKDNSQVLSKMTCVNKIFVEHGVYQKLKHFVNTP